MEYYYKQCEVRKYLRRNRETLEEDIVTVSNRNNLSVKKHMELLSLNDKEYIYILSILELWKINKISLLPGSSPFYFTHFMIYSMQKIYGASCIIQT